MGHNMATITKIENKFYISRRKTATKPETINLDFLEKQELLELFWRVELLSFEARQKLVTYLNEKGDSLKLWRGTDEKREYFDGINWKEYKPNYEE